jgi:Trp operon repressor
MNILILINECGISMREGKYIATLEQLEKLVARAKKTARGDTGAADAYTYLIEHDCTQREAADEYGVSQAALARYIAAGKLPRPDKRGRK